ncbi:hypothetical protein HK099_006294 [Clydaea vesicula]|uniref:Uncharacterized protein n=1 Tax=Clydaea vesicula TaxID=447962 RepID=A0AAD5XX22_9FUNG|nr:hypothetical protein HK099_006294 [Clydaea vesicula]KAJ3380974.1 hypothetical protein HDU92_005664 [Lobulomyces angularis]
MSLSLKTLSTGVVGFSIVSGSILHSAKPDSLLLRSVNNTMFSFSSFKRSRSSTPQEQFKRALYSLDAKSTQL